MFRGFALQRSCVVAAGDRALNKETAAGGFRSGHAIDAGDEELFDHRASGRFLQRRCHVRCGAFDVTISQPGIDPVKVGHVAGTMSHR